MFLDYGISQVAWDEIRPSALGFCHFTLCRGPLDGVPCSHVIQLFVIVKILLYAYILHKDVAVFSVIPTHVTKEFYEHDKVISFLSLFSSWVFLYELEDILPKVSFDSREQCLHVLSVVGFKRCMYDPELFPKKLS